MAGYSGTPLTKKLGIRAGCRLYVSAAPADYLALLEPMPEDVALVGAAVRTTDVVQLFVTSQEELASGLKRTIAKMRPDAAIWVSWPKKSSGVATDITEDTIRAAALPLGLVDVKVCAVDDTWSGLKLVVRKALRPPMTKGGRTRRRGSKGRSR